MKKMKIWNRALALVLSAGMALAPAASVLTCSMPVYAEETTDDPGNNANSSVRTVTTGTKNNAVLIYAVNDSTLKTGPGTDAANLEETLKKTDQFKTGVGTIENVGITQNSQEDALTGLWAKIDAIAENSTSDSLTVIYYSGHGGAEKGGESYLALQGKNNISAEALKTHLRKFKAGKVLVIIDACHSSGNIMLADEGDEEESTSGGVYNGEAFASALAGDTSMVSAGDGQQTAQMYFITAANRAETAIQSNAYGGMLTAALENALGHDRKNGDYHTYAADTTTKSGASSRGVYAGDGQITMKELVDYYQRMVITSTPVLYPQDDETVLFTYDESAGTPATFTSSVYNASGEQGNIQVDENGKITCKVQVQNLTSSPLSIVIGATRLTDTEVTTKTLEEQKGLDNSLEYVQLEPATVGAGNNPVTVEVELTWEAFKETENDASNPFSLRVWDASNKNYNLLEFYTSTTAGNGDIATDELALQVPTQLATTEGSAGNKKLVITKTSSILPMEIVYDDRTADKSSNPACTLSLYAYDLGEESNLPNCLHVDKDNSSLLKNIANQNVLDGVTKRTIFEGVRPYRARKAENDGALRDSVYTYAMNTSGLTVGHVYALQVKCDYDASTGYSPKSVWAIIKRVSAQEVDNETYKIPSFICTYDDLSYFRRIGSGIPMEGWNKSHAYSVDRSVAQVTKELVTALNNSEQNGRFSYSITADSGSETGWQKWDSSQKKWIVMDADDAFTDDAKYRCKLAVTVATGYNAVFTDETLFEFANHNTEVISVSNDGKTAELWLEHYLPKVETNVLKMYRVTNDGIGAEIPSTETLKEGEEVILVVSEQTKYNYDWYALRGLEKTSYSITKDGKKYRIYKVVTPTDGYNSVEVTTWNTGEKSKGDTAGSSGEKTPESCYCETDVYVWKIAESETSSDGSTSGSGSSGSSASEETSSGSTGTKSSSTTTNYICSEEQMENYTIAGGGIPVGTGWDAGSVSGVNSSWESILFELFLMDIMGDRYDQDVIWSLYDEEDGVETLLGSDAVFQAGQQYVSTITISIADGSNGVFDENSLFKFGNHKLLGKPVISADGKTATVKVLHTVENMDGNAVKLYFADTGEEITDDTQLQPGDLVRISAADGYGYYILGGLRASGTDGVYTVEYCQSASGLLGGIEILFYLADDPDGCGCGTMLYKHTVGNVGGYGQAGDSGQNGSSVKGAERSNTSVVSLGLVNGQTYSRGGAVGGTGDEGRLILWLLLSISSVAGLAEIYLLESRRRAVRRRKNASRRTQR